MDDEDMNQTKVQVKNNVINAIIEIGRPISVHEYEDWLRKNQPDLWAEVFKKCYDYTRVILTNAAKFGYLKKYHCNQPMEGIDYRSVFYGLHGQNYDADIWEELDERGKPKNKKRGGRSSSSHSLLHKREDNEPPKNESVINVDIDDSQSAFESWNYLNELIPETDPFWNNIMSAIFDVKSFISHGKDIKTAIEMVISKYSMNDERIKKHVIEILTHQAESAQMMDHFEFFS